MPEIINFGLYTIDTDYLAYLIKDKSSLEWSQSITMRKQRIKPDLTTPMFHFLKKKV